MRISSPRKTRISSPGLVPLPSGAPLMLLAFSLAAAFLLGFLVHEQGWHATLLRWGRAPGASFATWRVQAALPVVTSDMRFADYQRLLNLRERAVRLGVHVPFAGEDVPASVVSGSGVRVDARARLPGGAPAPLSGDTWPLDLRLADAADWVRLTPVTATGSEAAWEQWAYLEALRRAGFTAATQRLVRLHLNGRDLGLHILETPATAELLVAFDPRPAWEAQAAGEALFANGFRYATLTVIEGAASPAAAEALARLRAVQRGERVLSELCDAETLGRFLALTALWTGDPAPDWRTLRWAYDSATQQFSPVGAGHPWAETAPLPEAFLDDPAVQAAYARALVEFSTPAYLEQVRREWGPALEAQWLALGAPDTPWPLLEARQQTLRARLAPERAISATLAREGQGFVLSLANLQPFPLEITGLDAGGAALRTLDPAWVYPEDGVLLVESGDALVLRAAQGALPREVRLRLPWELTTAGGDTLTLIGRLWEVPAPELRIPVGEAFPEPERTP
ncbi:MAG: hypothetical protein ACLFU8_05730 [Anaerolineales bacterium]